VEGKKTLPFQLVNDSSYYQYAGYTPDVKDVLSTLNVNHIDSSSKYSWSLIYCNNYKPVVKAELVSKNLMPDVRNMTVKDALYLLENMNVKVVMKGRGKVVAQDVLPGTTVNKNQTVTLLLN
jgi:cell division protein FtsI (penicillin-binding protein 3)